ncbi:MAG TPA: hypothetical protein VFU64_04135 [Gaiellaceae bacterium]|nr:hypothetical protein [Gaiellaceae bacterium]
MSDEQRKDEDEDVDVESHSRHLTNLEPPAEGEEDGDVEAHMNRANVRMDSPSQI